VEVYRFVRGNAAVDLIIKPKCRRKAFAMRRHLPGHSGSLGSLSRPAHGSWAFGLRYNIGMPELSRFFGIIIRMYAEVNAPHHVPHFHAYPQDDVAIYSLDPVAHIAGYLPTRQRRLVEAWAELHQAELLAAWEQLQGGRKPDAIEPLR
jgi:hypothetical protein